MKCEPGDKFDFFTVIEEAQRNCGKRKVLCKCRCGKELIKSVNVLTQPSVYYKACGDCEYSLIKNLELRNLKYFEKLREKEKKLYRKSNKSQGKFDPDVVKTMNDLWR